MGLVEDVADDPVQSGGKNLFKDFVATLPEDEQAELWELLKIRGRAGAVYRALKKRGYQGAESTVFKYAREARESR